MKSMRDTLPPFAALVFLCVLGAVSDAQVTTPTYGYVSVPTVPQSDPSIFKVELNSNRLQAGGPIAIRVTTTPDVVAVETGNGPRSGELTRTSPGVFTAPLDLTPARRPRDHQDQPPLRRKDGGRPLDLGRRPGALSLNPRRLPRVVADSRSMRKTLVKAGVRTRRLPIWQPGVKSHVMDSGEATVLS